MHRVIRVSVKTTYLSAVAACRPRALHASSMKTSSIVWFRKGLRLHDNPALLEAAQDVDHLYPVFVLDPHFMNPEKIGVNRIQFLLESLKDLHESLRARGSRLLVLRGKPERFFQRRYKSGK
eukprot:jgi/Picre1/32806/NNA_008136.t1